MKKNLLGVITFVLVLINLILSGIIVFAVVPALNQSNALITKVATAIDLEAQAGTGDSASAYDISSIEAYDLSGSSDDKGMTINLKKGTDNKDHYAVIKVTLSLNTESDGYKKYKETLDSKKSLITTTINDVVSSYTIEEIKADQDKVEKEILKKLQEMFGSDDFIVDVGFSSATYQ